MFSALPGAMNVLKILTPEQKLAALEKYMVYWIDNYHATEVTIKEDDLEMTFGPTGALMLLNFEQWYGQNHCQYCGEEHEPGLIPYVMNHWSKCLKNPSIIRLN